MVFARYSSFLHYLQLASHELFTLWHKCDEKQNSKFPNSMMEVSINTSSPMHPFRTIGGRNATILPTCGTRTHIGVKLLISALAPDPICSRYMILVIMISIAIRFSFPTLKNASQFQQCYSSNILHVNCIREMYVRGMLTYLCVCAKGTGIWCESVVQLGWW